MSTSLANLMPPHEALTALTANLHPVGREALDGSKAAGRVLAKPLEADRDSPPMDVSAMDGYAVRLADLSSGVMAVAGELAIGKAPPSLPSGQVMRIFTGGGVPEGAEAVVRREDCEEMPDRISLRIDPNTLEPGQNIRFRAENLQKTQRVLEAGNVIHVPLAAALASFGTARPVVHRRVCLSVIVTGDELLAPEASPQPWQLRDANGPALHNLFAGLPWIDWQGLHRVPDQPQALEAALELQLALCDAVLLTGGISMGNHDYVPQAVQRVGGRPLFYKLAIRPGKPMLGAVGPDGQAILGLPGNPVSVMTTARLIASVALRRRAGFAQPNKPTACVRLMNPDDKALDLWWYRPVRLLEDGQAELVVGKGSGDVVAAARSDGFVQMPPRASGEGPWLFWPWTM